jgi:NAD(P)-dependent dehydrogenase (short-subunit alcohol dehydrogenase family)
MTYRSKSKTDEAIEKLRAAYPDVQYRPLKMDLSKQMSVRAAAKELNKWPENIDILFNNAGVMSLQDHILVDGIEMHFATNHIGHFLFTNLIMDKLLQSAKTSAPGATRVINVSGGWHTMSPVRFDDLNFEGKPIPDEQQPNKEKLKKFGFDPDAQYIPEAAYGQSKTGNILFSLYLNNHLAEKGILSFAMCPGGVHSDIGRHYPEPVANRIYASGLLDKTQAQGAAPAVVAAFDPALTGKFSDGLRMHDKLTLDTAKSGIFLENCQISDPAPYASDPAIAERLWTVSEELVREQFAY